VSCHIYILFIKRKKKEKEKEMTRMVNNPILLEVVQPPQFGRLEVAKPPLGQAPQSTIPNG
jgi:hypothetical protein